MNDTTTISSAADFTAGPQALDALRPTLLSMPDEALLPARFSMLGGMTRALGLARAYAADRPRFAGAFSLAAFDPAVYDDMELRVQALWQADVDYRLLVDPQRALPPLVEEATPLRRALLRAATYLWGEDDTLGDQVAAIRRGRSTLDLADDLNALASLFEAHWADAIGRCAVTPDDLDRARQLGLRIAHALTDDDSALGRARDLRTRAAIYLKQGVDEVRAAAAFVFRHEPDRLAAYPSLFGGRTPMRSDRTSAIAAGAADPEVASDGDVVSNADNAAASTGAAGPATPATPDTSAVTVAASVG
ncbi:MAG: hypothetical protein AAGC55_07925 [Myxococcota bacterium]